MPDGDKFGRWIQSRKLKKAYGLVIGGADLDILARLLRSDLNDAKKTDYRCFVLHEFAQVVYDSLRRPLLAEQDMPEFSQRLDNLVASQDDSRGARLAAKAAEKVRSRILADNETPSLGEVKQQVLTQFDEQLLVTRFLAPARQGIVNKTHRSHSEQQNWEQQVRKDVVENKRRVRRIASSTSLEMLHTPLIARER